MAKRDPEAAAHRTWLGLVQPVGLVVSPPALVKAQAVLPKNVVEEQQKLLSVVRQSPRTAFSDDADPYLDDFPRFAEAILGWDAKVLAGTPGGRGLDDKLQLILPDYGETVRPDFAVVDEFSGNQALILVQVLSVGTSLDDPPREHAKSVGWHASPQAKLERLLRETEVPAGLLCNGHELRLVYAPRGETSGHLTFPVPAMCEVSGRNILSAAIMLLGRQRVIDALDGRRLLDILSESRKYQAEVSNALSDQVLGALWELLRGFQASDPEDGRRIFDQTAREAPEHIYGGLLTLLMRLIFVLYAEDQGLMPKGEVYANNYSVAGLYERLRTDMGRYPDTMDQRYGAYAWLLSLFRLIFDGGGHGGMRLPTRHGQLFNPDEFPFLEGRPMGVGRVMKEKSEVPRVSDGCVYRVLDALLMLDVDGDGIADRLSYRALDVEQIGSVYEAMMGYEVERAYGRSIAVRPTHIVVDVDELLEVDGGKRKKWLKDRAECDLTGGPLKALKAAETPQDVVAALARRVSPRSVDVGKMPQLMAPGSLYLQPGEERRRTGSHYTPRELTEPIVRTTLRPVLEALGERPTPEQILDLKVCDPAMGSGAFLVEATRQLAEQLVTAWELHDTMPKIPADEEPILHARRLVAQRCIYGVDKNPFAVNLAKLSIWLVTLAKDHAFTFIDHALKHGDSLVGLTKKQIAAFHWKTDKGPAMDLFERKLKQDLEDALGWRDALQGLDEGDYNQKKDAWWEAENSLADARLIGDLVVAAFFGADRPKARNELRDQFRNKVEAWRAGEVRRSEFEGIVEELRCGEERGGRQPVQPMHWEIEFPEVFGRETPGFDAMVGNPPFLGGRRISTVLGQLYRNWLDLFPESRGNADLCSFFFRGMFLNIKAPGTLGLVATNTIGQGDTRSSGLRWICTNGGTIFSATRRYRWPGAAAVIVSLVHILRGKSAATPEIDGVEVPKITAFLFHSGSHDDPARLIENHGKSYQGSLVLGSGFIFDDHKSGATPIKEMDRLIGANPRNSERIFPFIGGEEVNSSPTHSHHRYVINFGEMSEQEARRWPGLMGVLEEKVRPERQRKSKEIARYPWWWFWRTRSELYASICRLDRVFVNSQVSSHHSFCAQPTDRVWAHTLYVYTDSRFSFFGVLQSRVHELWARFFGSSMKDDLRYTASTCFETFPFPKSWQTAPTLEAAGKNYYEFRAALMVRNNEGLTKTYNRFHNPENHEPDIVKLREVQAAMDRAVLDAYGWDDIPIESMPVLDYEIDEETWGKKKKPYRYRWPAAVHDEVLARLLDLPQKRYQDEVAAGLHAKKGAKKKTAAKPKRKKAKSLPTTQAGFTFGATTDSEETP